MTLLELKYQIGLSNGCIYFNKDDWNDLHLQEDDLVILKDQDTRKIVLMKAKSNETITSFTVVADPNILEDKGFQEGAIVEIVQYKGAIHIAKQVEIEYNLLDLDHENFVSNSNLDNLKKFLSIYYYQSFSEIYWDEMNVQLRLNVKEPIDPNNSATSFYQIDPQKTVIILREEVQSMPFNALLLIDKSGSMARQDVLIKKAEHHVDKLYTIFSEGREEYLKRNYRDLYDWFKKIKDYIKKSKRHQQLYDFEKNQEITIQKGVGRLDSVLLATLSFFQLKISRGKGEKCAFVLYGDDARPIMINNKPYIDATEFSPDLCNTLLKIIFDSNFMRYGKTNISAGIEHITAIARQFKLLNSNPLMILLLTDGKPHPPELDDYENVISTFKYIQKELDALSVPFVFYTIGIGEKHSVDQSLLSRLAKLGKGEFHFVDNMDHLVNWYERLAQDYTITLNQR